MTRRLRVSVGAMGARLSHTLGVLHHFGVARVLVLFGLWVSSSFYRPFYMVIVLLLGDAAVVRGGGARVLVRGCLSRRLGRRRFRRLGR